MTTRTLTGTYSSYYVSPSVTLLSIAASGYVGGYSGAKAGVYTNPSSRFPLTIQNDGRIVGPVGVYMTRAGSVINGSASDTLASIRGYLGVVTGSGVSGQVSNFGTIAAIYYGVELFDGGSVTNGSVADNRATINVSVNEAEYLPDGVGVRVVGAAGAVTNFGTINSQSSPGAVAGAGVELLAGGSLINGAETDTAARIRGDYGVILGTAGTVANFGAITGDGGRGWAVDMDAEGGVVVNGSAQDGRALIAGIDAGIYADRLATVSNFGAILASPGAYGDAVRLESGGVVTNGSATDTNALIQGYSGVVMSGYGVVANFGRIEGLGQGQNGVGVALSEGGRLTNGAAGGPTATITGYYGVKVENAMVANYGVIHGYGAFGAVLYGGSLTNGAAGDSGALIEATTGVDMLIASTLTNFGTIVGTGGEAVRLENSTSTLIVEAGCAFQGAVIGNRGTLVLDSGTSALTLLADADAVISGSMATTTFTNFGAVDIEPHAAANLVGDGVVPGGNTLSVEGALDIGGALNVAGSLVASGTLSGAGTLALGAGDATFGAGTTLAIAHVSQTDPGGVASVAPGVNLSYAGTWKQTAGTLMGGTGILDGGSMTFTGAGKQFQRHARGTDRHHRRFRHSRRHLHPGLRHHRRDGPGHLAGPDHHGLRRRNRR